MPLCRRRLTARWADQFQTPSWGARRNQGLAAGLKTTRRKTSPAMVCSALDCGNPASPVVTATTDVGRTKLNSVCCTAQAGEANAALNAVAIR